MSSLGNEAGCGFGSTVTWMGVWRPCDPPRPWRRRRSAGAGVGRGARLRPEGGGGLSTGGMTLELGDVARAWFVPGAVSVERGPAPGTPAWQEPESKEGQEEDHWHAGPAREGRGTHGMNIPRCMTCKMGHWATIEYAVSLSDHGTVLGGCPYFIPAFAPHPGPLPVRRGEGARRTSVSSKKQAPRFGPELGIREPVAR